MATTWLALFLFIDALHCSTHFVVNENKQIVDEYGRESYFHGVNVIYKSHPYIPITTHFDSNLSFCEQDMQLLSSLGVNIIRLGVMWPGVSPSYNEYNQSYLDELKQLITTAYEKYNIYTLVDCHQDAISASFCGEGAPFWAVNLSITNTDEYDEWNFPLPVINESFNTSNTEQHIPSKADCQQFAFTKYYHSYDVSNMFEKLYSNYRNLTDLFGEYWSVVARNFKNVSGILGFELLNEPWPGNMYKNESLQFPSYVNRYILQPFYNRLASFIHQYDNDRIIFYEPVTYHLSPLDGIAFTSNPGGEAYSNRSVLAFHYYTVPNIEPQDEYFGRHVRYSNEVLNTTAFLTEFFIGNNIESPQQFDFTSKTMSVADKYLISWIGWEYKIFACALPNGTCTGPSYGVFHQNGTLNTMMAKVISRTYAQKVAGNTVTMYFDHTSGEFELEYTLNTSIVEPTVIYVSTQYWYLRGYNISITPSNQDIVTYNVTADRIQIFGSSDSQYNNCSVYVRIRSM